MKELFELYSAFFRIGLFTFGGGYAMLPMLQREVVNKYHWATDEELLDCYAIGQCTPGVIAVNTATYVGSQRKGIAGSIVSTVGVVFPSLIIISVIALFLRSFADNVYVRHAFAGIRVAVGVLVCDALIKLYKKGVKGALANGIFIAAALFALLTNFSPVWVVLVAIVLGVGDALRKGRAK